MACIKAALREKGGRLCFGTLGSKNFAVIENEALKVPGGKPSIHSGQNIVYWEGVQSDV